MITSIGWSDPRIIDGELLWPERFGRQKSKHSSALWAATPQPGSCSSSPPPQKAASLNGIGGDTGSLGHFSPTCSGAAAIGRARKCAGG